MSTNTTATNPNATLGLGIANTAFMLDKLGSECGPMQQYRELTMNGIQAIEAAGGVGDVRWDVYWPLLEQTGVYKLCCIDTGVGMTGPEMLEYVNNLSSSVHEQGENGNFGVGAKIAAMTRNHDGLLYLSWKDGQGEMVHLWRDPDNNEYGAKQFELADGSFAHYAPVPDELKPRDPKSGDAFIGEHGTCVILLGNDAEEDTTQCPDPSFGDGQTRWMTKYLNTRFAALPDGVSVKARENMRSGNLKNVVFKEIDGQRAYLNTHSDTCGVVELDDAKIHWWITQEGDHAKKNSARFQASMHTAVLYQGEVYEIATAKKASSLLNSFGVIFGTGRVVLYVEPTGDATSNLARTGIIIEGAELPLAEWGVQFASQMPAELVELQEKASGAGDSKDRQKAMQERLRAVSQFFQVSRYRPAGRGDSHLDSTPGTEPAAPARRERERVESGPSVPTQTTPAERKPRNPRELFEKIARQGQRAEQAAMGPAIPEVKWMSATMGGEYALRENDEMDDRAAKYVAGQNLILANADFRIFADMVAHYIGVYGDKPGFEQVVREAIEIWMSQSLAETVMGVRSLAGSQKWSEQAVEAALSEEALTAAVMQRYHVDSAVRRHLGSKGMHKSVGGHLRLAA